MADMANAHPTDGRRRKEKGPPSNLALPRLERVSDTEREHSEDSAGEKEAKRQRSNPGTPVSTPRRMPYDYDAMMGITRVGTREAEGFDEDLDSTEYHDANDNTEEPIRKEETDVDTQTPNSTGLQGGYGSSSLKECIELLSATNRVTPAPLDSGIGDSAGPPQVMSPSMEKSLTGEETQPSSGSISHEAALVTTPIDGSTSQEALPVKDEPVSQVKCESAKEMKNESSSSTQEVKVKQEESETVGENATSVKQEEQQEEQAPGPDSEDSLAPERTIEVLQRLLEIQESRTREDGQEDREISSPHANPRERISGSETSRGHEYGPYAPQGARRTRRRYDSPDPFMFNTTIFIEHEALANEMQDDPIGSLHSRLRCVEHNIETLRTRLTQVFDLRDTQGIRRDHRAIATRLDEVEEYASASTFREFMTKIQRLESMLLTDGGGAVGEAIRLCNRRIDQQQATLDDVRNRVRTQEANPEGSEENSENICGRENRTMDRRRRRVIPSQEIWRSPMPRPPPPPQVSEMPRADPDQQASSRLFTAYNQCVSRTGQLENRFDQFRFEIRRDATEMALVLQGHEQRVSTHSRELRQLHESHEEMQGRITGIDNLSKTIIDHDHHVTQEFDRATHSQKASICGLIKEQEDLRKMIEELAGRFDRSQDSLSTPQDEASTGVLLDLGDLKTKVARLIEQHTQMDGEVSFLKSLHESVKSLVSR